MSQACVEKDRLLPVKSTVLIGLTLSHIFCSSAKLRPFHANTEMNSAFYAPALPSQPHWNKSCQRKRTEASNHFQRVDRLA